LHNRARDHRQERTHRDGCVIRNVEGVVEAEGAGYSIHEGVVIVAKNGVLPPARRSEPGESH